MTTMTLNQRKQIVRFIERKLDALRLDADGAQRVIENGGDFQTDLGDLILMYAVNGSRFTDRVYPGNYRPKSIEEQVATLRKVFPDLRGATYDESIALGPLPAGAEGWFAIPRWHLLGATYGEAVEKVLDSIRFSRMFYNHRKGQMNLLRQHASTIEALRKIGDEQKGHDILVVACQFGLRHRGCSARRAREIMYEEGGLEFGLGAFAVGCMLLTNPEREVRPKQLHVLCAGDESAEPPEEREAETEAATVVACFSQVPCFEVNSNFYFGFNELEFNARWFGNDSDQFGAVSGFRTTA
jgi:hypothetical protein